MLPAKRINALLDECEQLGNILGQSIVTAKANGARPNSRTSTPSI